MEAEEVMRHIVADAEEKRLNLFKESIKNAGSEELASISTDLIQKIEKYASKGTSGDADSAPNPTNRTAAQTTSRQLSMDEKRSLSFLDIATKQVEELAKQDKERAAQNKKRREWSGFSDWKLDLKDEDFKVSKPKRSARAAISKGPDGGPAFEVMKLKAKGGMKWNMASPAKDMDEVASVSPTPDTVDVIEEVTEPDIVVTRHEEPPTKPRPAAAEKKPVKKEPPKEVSAEVSTPKVEKRTAESVKAKSSTKVASESTYQKPTKAKTEIPAKVASSSKAKISPVEGPVAEKRDNLKKAKKTKVKAANKPLGQGIVIALIGAVLGLGGAGASLLKFGQSEAISLIIGGLIITNASIFLKLLGKPSLKTSFFSMSIYIASALSLLQFTDLTRHNNTMPQSLVISFIAIAVACVLAAASYQPKKG